MTERAIIDIIDELTDVVAIFFDKRKGHVVIPALGGVNQNIRILDAESPVPREETVLDAIPAMEGVAFAIHASGDTIVTGSIDISATMELPVTDYRYVSGRIRPNRITQAHEP